MDHADDKLSKFEGSASFENRKKDHIYWSLSQESQADLSPSSQIKLSHNPLPEIDFSEVSLKSSSGLFKNSKPLLISSMTGGHEDSQNINQKLVEVAFKNNWIFSTGSLRREIEDENFKFSEWEKLRENFSDLSLIGNIGLPQIIESRHRVRLVSFLSKLKFDGLFIHLNPLQEALQIEGTPNYKGGLKAIKALKEELSIPVLLKETGTGFSKESIKNLTEVDIDALDVSGFGGTHWGRIEGLRADKNSLEYKTAKTFKNWGHSTVESLISFKESDFNKEVWASGGLRSGLDAAVCFALGAKVCGFAKPFMEAAVSKGDEDLQDLIDQIEYELKTALFCTGSKSINDLASQGGWSWMK